MLPTQYRLPGYLQFLCQLALCKLFLASINFSGKSIFLSSTIHVKALKIKCILGYNSGILSYILNR